MRTLAPYVLTLSAAFILTGIRPAYGSDVCRETFSTESVQINLALRELATIRLKLDSKRGQHRPGANLEALEARFKAKASELARELHLTGDELSARLRESISTRLSPGPQTDSIDKQKEVREREKAAINEPRPDGSKILIQTVNSASYQMRVKTLAGQLERQDFQVPRAFGLAATLTTQVVWTAVVQAALRRFPDDPYNASLVVLRPHTKGDLYPIENATYLEVIKWFEMLNKLGEVNDPVMQLYFPGHTPDRRYRLPTLAEWGLVATRRGQTMDLFSFPDDEIDDYAWTRENAKGQSHEVATRIATTYEGLQFFDLYGNVSELTPDRVMAATYAEEVKFVDASTKTHIAISGGNFNLKPDDCAAERPFYPRVRSNSLGFRIAVDFSTQGAQP